MFSKIPAWILLVAFLAVVLLSYEFSTHRVQVVPKSDVVVVVPPPVDTKVDTKVDDKKVPEVKKEDPPIPEQTPVVQQDDVPQTNESPKAVDTVPVAKPVVVKKPKVVKKDPQTTPPVVPQEDPFSTFVKDIFNIH